MECLRAAELLMAEHDGERVDAQDLAHAHEHCASCGECMALTALVSRLEALPPLRAPQDLVERVITQSSEVAADIREARAAHEALLALGATVDEPGAQTATPSRGGLRIVPQWWGPRFTMAAAAAAVVLLALGVGTVGVLGMIGSQAGDEDGTLMVESAATEEADEAAEGDGTADGDYTLASPPAGDASVSSARAAAPSYVVLDNRVWVLVEVPSAGPSALSTAGVVSSSLGTDGEVTEHTSYVSPDGSMLWVAADDGGFMAFAPVVRTMGLATYALTTDADIPWFGTWPTLPSRFAAPTSAEGAPTFMLYGFDDRNLNVFIPPGGRVEDGFALQPGTPADDPAAGNPNWTWWEPVR